MTDLNSLTNVAATYPNVIVEGSEIYLGSKGSTKRIKLYPVTFEWFDGDFTNQDWTECQFVDAYLSELSQHLDFIEMFINGEFPVKATDWDKIYQEIIVDCLLRSCVWEARQWCRYNALTESTYIVSGKEFFHRNDHFPDIQALTYNETVAWFWDKYEEFRRDIVVFHNEKFNELRPTTPQDYIEIGDDEADFWIYKLVKVDFPLGIDWDEIVRCLENIDDDLHRLVTNYLYPGLQAFVDETAT